MCHYCHCKCCQCQVVVLNESQKQDVLVWQQPYFRAISESGNILLNNDPAWSDAANGMLCSTKKSVKSTSAFVTPTYVLPITKSGTFFISPNFCLILVFISSHMFRNVTFSAVLNADVSRINCAKCVINSQSWFANDWSLQAICVSERLFDTKSLCSRWFNSIIFIYAFFWSTSLCTS